jgi:hypothetical protein
MVVKNPFAPFNNFKQQAVKQKKKQDKAQQFRKCPFTLLFKIGNK